MFGHRSYEWLGPELALLASLTGQMPTKQIAALLTKRLRAVTGDRKAVRNLNAINTKRQVIGVLTSDLLGGITVPEAGREVKSLALVYQAIDKGTLTPRHVGHRLVIPLDQWEAWKTSRVFPPSGFVRLASIRVKLGIKNDALSTYARDGLIPTAMRCNPYGTRQHSTQYGTWYIDGKLARKLVADRRAGRPLPWHGAPNTWNLQATWKRLEQRRHPGTCHACREIWGPQGAPREFEDYTVRYPALTFAQKRHLTVPYVDGVLLVDAARQANVSVETVKRAVRDGTVKQSGAGRPMRVTSASLQSWIRRGAATGGRANTWIALKTAKRLYGFTLAELRRHVASGEIEFRIGTAGPQAGLEMVHKRQCATLRERLGYTVSQAARRAGISTAKAITILNSTGWTPGGSVDPKVLAARTTGRANLANYSYAQAAKALRRPVSWIKVQIRTGVVRPIRDINDRRRICLTESMVRRLAAARKPRRRVAPQLNSEWVPSGTACEIAGVSQGTLSKWCEEGGIAVRASAQQRRFHIRSVKRRARRYWRGQVRGRAQPPGWLLDERPAIDDRRARRSSFESSVLVYAR